MVRSALLVAKELEVKKRLELKFVNEKNSFVGSFIEVSQWKNL